MPGSGTDKTKPWTDVGGPIVVLVEPQLGQNIGTAARAMANFGLTRLRLVKPRDGWPDIQAVRAAGGRLSLIGNVNNIEVLLAGTQEAVEKQACYAIESGVRVLSPECAVPLRTPLENLKAIKRGVKRLV